MAAMDEEEGVPLQVALGKVIRAMGVKEFLAKVRMASPNLLRAINPRHNPTQETLNRLLKPFRLRLSPGHPFRRPPRALNEFVRTLLQDLIESAHLLGGCEEEAHRFVKGGARLIGSSAGTDYINGHRVCDELCSFLPDVYRVIDSHVIFLPHRASRLPGSKNTMLSHPSGCQ